MPENDMKIAIIANSDIGLFKFRRELILRFLHSGYRVLIMSPKGNYISYFVEQGCLFYETEVDRRGKNVCKDAGLFYSYFKILKCEKPDMTFLFTIKPNIYGGLAAQILKMPYAATITGLGSALENKSVLQGFIISLYKIAFRKISMIFFQNKENRNFFISNKLTKGSYCLLPGSGVNLEYFQLLPYPNESCIEFVFISRIMKEKGIEEYLEAAEKIYKKYPNTKFHICGFCEEAYDNFIKEKEKKGIVVYHGMVSDVRKILESIHCTIHPSYYPEGMSNVCLESAACGRPVITTNRSGCRETVDNGISGYIVNQKDSGDLIEKIEKFLLLSYEAKKEMGLNARKKMVREFSREIVIENYMKVLPK